MAFYSGTTTAYPLPHPGDGPAPKPMTLPAGKLHDALGIREVSYTKGGDRFGVERAEAAMNLTSVLVRIGFVVSLLSSAASHAYLYVHGYQHIPMIGTAFLIQASVSFAVAAADPSRRSLVAALDRGRDSRRLSGRLRSVQNHPGSSALPSVVGTLRRTRRSAWVLKC